jgi:chromate transport protein ChrA
MNENTNALAEMDKLPVSKAVLKNVLPAALIMLMSLVYNMAEWRTKFLLEWQTMITWLPP